MLIILRGSQGEKLPLLSTGGRENELGSAGKRAGEAPWIPLEWVRELLASAHSVGKGQGRCWAVGKDLLLTNSAKNWEKAPERGHELWKNHPSYLRAPS